ncbi:MAG: GNAT family N-acetyltransferase [Patescibacteria group bacterium]|jgi:hypothetical protein
MIELKVISDLETARKVWEALSPGETIYDLWEFRLCFYRQEPQALYFYTIYENEQPVALLPLQYNQELVCLEFFAENFMDDNRPFFRPGYEYLLPQLFQIDFKQTVKIYDLKGEDKFTSALPLEDYIYFLDTTNLRSFDDYLKQAFSDGHKRANFKRLFTLLERDHEVKVNVNDFNDLSLIIDLNVKHFGDESYLRTVKERQAFYDLLKLPLDWHLITISVDGQKLAGSLAIIYRGTYFYLLVGSDLSIFPNVFKYLTKINLETALAKAVKIFDCSLGDCNWKSHWHLARRPLYKFIKSPATDIN